MLPALAFKGYIAHLCILKGYENDEDFALIYRYQYLNFKTFSAPRNFPYLVAYITFTSFVTQKDIKYLTYYDYAKSD